MTTHLSQRYRLDDFIDTFALGHYARVFDALDLQSRQRVAFKVMRAEHLNREGDIRWEYRAFPNEADLLMRLQENPHVVNLLDCGFIDNLDEAPTSGEIVSFGYDVQAFAAAVPDYASRSWRPYLVLENLPRSQNLLYLMKPNRPGVRWRLPSEEGIALALQFGELLRAAHAQRIVYLDHKLEHVYWDGQQLQVIDMNSSRLLTDDPADDPYFRMDIHSLCVGILYPLFTGLSPQKTALRPQPSGMAEVESRYQEVTTLDFGVEPGLSQMLQAVMQRGAEMQIETADEFIDVLYEVAVLHGWDAPGYRTTDANRTARERLQTGLQRLREGQEYIREARDLFREAAIQDGITEDLEAELRRLVKSANDMLNSRVIP